VVTCVRDIRLRILVLMLLLTALDLASHNGLSQDVVLMEEAVWANADCYRNYDASFESTVLAEVPKDPLELSRLVEKLEARGLQMWDEKQRRSRIVLSNTPPLQVLFASEWIWLRKGRSVHQSATVGLWNDKVSRLFTSKLPPGVSISPSGKSQFDFFRMCDVPVLEECEGDLFEGVSHPKEYFEDKLLFRDKMREGLSKAEIRQLPSGTIRTSYKFPGFQSIKDYDPVSSHGFYAATIPFDEKTSDSGEVSSWRRWNHQKHNNVFRISSVTSKHMDHGMVAHGSAVVRWHQFNEEAIRWPVSLVENLSLEGGLQFLTEGQSDAERLK
jgi:hypothetical protein